MAQPTGDTAPSLQSPEALAPEEPQPTRVCHRVVVGDIVIRSGATTPPHQEDGILRATPFLLSPVEVFVRKMVGVEGDHPAAGATDDTNGLEEDLDLNGLRDKLARVTAKNAELKGLNTSFAAEIQRLRKEVSQLYAQKNKLAQNVHKFINGLLGQVQQATHTNAFLTSECRRLHDLHSTDSLRVKAAEDRLHHNNRLVEELTEDNDALCTVNEYLEEKCSSLESIVNRLASGEPPVPPPQYMF